MVAFAEASATHDATDLGVTFGVGVFAVGAGLSWGAADADAGAKAGPVVFGVLCAFVAVGAKEVGFGVRIEVVLVGAACSFVFHSVVSVNWLEYKYKQFSPGTKVIH